MNTYMITIQNRIPYVIISVTFHMPPKYQAKHFWHLQLILEKMIMFVTQHPLYCIHD